MWIDRYVILAAIFMAAVTSPVQGQRPALEPADSTLVAVATAMVRAAPDVAEIWPEFWSEDQPFILLRPMETVLLISSTPPSADYVPVAASVLPPPLRGRAFLRRGYLPGLNENTFSAALPLGDDTVPALEPKGSDLADRLGLYYHESFHGFQRQRGAFVITPEDRRIVRYKEPLVDPAHLTPAFAAAAELERRLLSQALEIENPDSLRALLRSYVALRRARSGGHLDVIEVERRMERREGVAEYVECRAAAAATDAPPERVRTCIQEELRLDLETRPAMPEADARLMRWRLYGTGAALALLLDRLHPGWKPLIEEGMHLDQLVAQAVGFDPRDAEQLVERAR